MIPYAHYPVLPQLLLRAQQMPCGSGRDQDEGSFLQRAVLASEMPLVRSQGRGTRL